MVVADGREWWRAELGKRSQPGREVREDWQAGRQMTG